MIKSITILTIVALLLLTGCSMMAVEEPPEQKGDTIYFKGITWTYKQLSVKNWKARTDDFGIDGQGCLLIQANSWVDSTTHEGHFEVQTDIDPCKYQSITTNSTLTSRAFRIQETPSSQIWVQGRKYSSHAFDNITKELILHNLYFYSDGADLRLTFDEGHALDSKCGGNLTFIIRAAGDINATAQSSLQICDIKLKEREDG